MSLDDLGRFAVPVLVLLFVILSSIWGKKNKRDPVRRTEKTASPQPQGRVEIKPPTPRPQELSENLSPAERRPPRIQRLMRGKKHLREALLIREILRRPWG